MRIVYNLGNFTTGKVARVYTKSALEQYIQLGYTLISTIWK